MEPRPRPWDESTVFLFPASGDDTPRLGRAPPSHIITVDLCWWERLAALSDQAQDDWVIGNPMKTLSPKTFSFQFRNLETAPERNSTFLCFEVEGERYCYHDTGVFQNQSYPKEPIHAELLFLEWFYDTILSPNENYCITWYLSWSPCFDCAEEVVKFLRQHENVSLKVLASRLYLCSEEDEQGLRHLAWAGAEVAVMSPEDFQYCWDNFVTNRGKDFWFWRNVRRNYHILDEQLQEILRTPDETDVPLVSQLPLLVRTSVRLDLKTFRDRDEGLL